MRQQQYLNPNEYKTMPQQGYFAKLMFYNENTELLKLRKTFEEEASSQNHRQILRLKDINKLAPSQDNLKQNTQSLYSSIQQKLEQENIQLGFLIHQLWGIYKFELIWTLVLFCITMIVDFGRFYAFKILLENVSNYQQVKGKVSTYMLGLIFASTIFVFFQLHYHSIHQLQKLGNKLKNTLRLSLEKKILSLKKHEIDSSKILSIVEELQDIVQINLPFIYKFFTFPLFILPIIFTVQKEIVICTLLMILLEVIVIVLQYYYSKENSKNQAKMNSTKDAKLNLIQQAVEHIKTIKMNIWQTLFHQKIKTIRQKQSQKNIDFAIGRAITIGLAYSTSYIIIFLVLIYTYMMNNNSLNTAIIYSVYYLSKRLHINIIRGQKATFAIFQIKVSLNRYLQIFNIPVCKDDERSNLLGEGQVSFKGYTIYKNQEEDQADTILSDINLHVQRGEFVGIVGKNGSGKSSILNSLLGQFSYKKGTLFHKGKLAAIEQKPTIFSTTIKQNIILDRQYNQERYKQCLKISCLDEDLQQLSLGDHSVAGEKGGMLSGGQKVRICLARVLYEEMDIYVFDDILNALDKKVSLQVMDNLSEKVIGRNTLLLITHNINTLAKCDKIVLLSEGRIKRIFAKSQFQQFEKVSRQVFYNTQDREVKEKQKKNIPQIFQPNQENQQNTLKQFDEFYQPNQEKIQEQLINPRSSFAKTFVSYFFYNQRGRIFFIVSVTLFLISQIVGAIFIKQMQRFEKLNKFHHEKLKIFWSILLLLSILVIIFDFLKQFSLIHSMQKSNDSLHENSTRSLLKTKTSFFDSQPSGSIITIYSLHINNLDTNIYPQLYECMYSLAFFIVSLVVSSILNVSLLPVFIVLSIFFVVFNINYKKIVLQCRILDLEYRKPISNMFSQTINGLNEIKIFKKEGYFYEMMVEKILNSERASMGFLRTLRAYCILAFYLLMAAMAIGTFLILLSLDNENKHTIGAKLIFLIESLCRFTLFTSFQIILDSKMKSFGKILQKVELQSEYYQKQGQDRELIEQLQVNSPQNEAGLKFENLSLKYPKKDTLALKDLSFKIDSGQHIGIVGRTGSGKSSIVQVLFRLVQPLKSSAYEIGSKNALDIGLIQLRNMFSIIPQKPFIFTGSLRENIDPYSLFTDQQIQKNLDKVGLLERVNNFTDGLSTFYHSSLQLLSAGEQQLFCIARVMLRNTPIVVLDEATSQVDEQSNQRIINIVQSSFRKKRILIEIAHKLQNIKDCSRIFVIKQGRKVEEGTFDRLGKSDSEFFALLQKEKQDENNKKHN